MLAQETTLELPGLSPSFERDHPREHVTLFEALYERHREAVFRYLRARTADEDEALDLAATTFERALRHLERNPTVELGVGWLLRTARNAAVDARRRRRAAEVVGHVLRWQDKDESSPEVLALADEQAAMVRRAVAALPEPQRDVVALRFTTELTIREIGQVVGRSESATQKQLSRGLARLREALDDEP